MNYGTLSAAAVEELEPSSLSEILWHAISWPLQWREWRLLINKILFPPVAGRHNRLRDSICKDCLRNVPHRSSWIASFLAAMVSQIV